MASMNRASTVIDPVTIHGTCDERFTNVRDLLAAQLTSGADIGASAAVFIDGEPVVDIWGGQNATRSSTPSRRRRP
jgi:hypothetical protein